MRKLDVWHVDSVVMMYKRDWRKIRRVLRAAEVVARHRNHLFRDLRLAADLAGEAIDALNKRPK